MHEYAKIARQAIETYVKEGVVLDLPVDVSAPLKNEQAGTFVSLHLKADDSLRGCIGTFAPMRDSLGEEIIHNAISAATSDPRFNEITEDELEDLDISVDVLSAPEKCKKENLDPKKYGVIVTAGFRRGLLLPDLPGIDKVDYQLNIACQKAGIGYETEPFEIERFTVERYH